MRDIIEQITDRFCIGFPGNCTGSNHGPYDALHVDLIRKEQMLAERMNKSCKSHLTG